jgi:hypothetical protein
MARWCYAVNAVAALAHLAILEIGLVLHYPINTGPPYGFLASWFVLALVPYALMAGVARRFSDSRAVTTTAFVVSLLGALAAVPIDVGGIPPTTTAATGSAASPALHAAPHRRHPTPNPAALTRATAQCVGVRP